MHSCIFSGQVKHSRSVPVEHAFRYRLFMMYLDLEELPQLFRGRWFWSTARPALARFRREDYLGTLAFHWTKPCATWSCSEPAGVRTGRYGC